MESLLLMVAMIAVFYFLIIRPENKRKKQAEQMRSSLKKGDRVTICMPNCPQALHHRRYGRQDRAGQRLYHRL